MASEAYRQFVASLDKAGPPPGLAPPLAALWQARRGAWDAAHALVQDQPDVDSAWVHAHLHRQEGDLSNAGYWYRRASRPQASEPLDEEWTSIARTLLG